MISTAQKSQTSQCAVISRASVSSAGV